MTLGTFVSAAYALMVRVYAGIPDKTLLEAIDLANKSFGLESKTQVSEGAKNAAALQQLERMMAGVQ